MVDKEKVIKGLELCKYDPDPGQEDKWNHSCLKCPYCWSGPETEPFTTRDCWKLFADALDLLREQEAVEPKTGHWIVLENCSNAGVYCSECNTKIFDNYPMKKKLSQFCGHCGAKMEGSVRLE